ncbi:MAG: hypothetical protein EHM12_12130 [Dehalococcoidia bacterium]|nr:MAG: hypothetical protein EHM12_12130 [Dehalococcoidia bacterium]
MANTFKYVRGQETLQALPIGSGVVVEIGTHLKLSGGLVTPVAAATDNLAYIGVAKEAHRAVEGAGKITVALPNAEAIYRVPLDAASTWVVGDLFQLNSTQKLAKNTTDAVAVAVNAGTSATEVEVMYLLPNTTGGLRFVGDAS